MFSNFSFENRAICEIMWKNIVEQGGPQRTVLRMDIACWIPKATNAQSKCVILIVFPLQQWLHERAWLLPYKYIASLVSSFDSCFPPVPLFASCLSLYRFCLILSFTFLSHPPLSVLHLFALPRAVPWLRRLAFGLWPRRVGFDPRPVRTRFVCRVAVW
jgi:hypothetical protein